MESLHQESLDYHAKSPAGKVDVRSSKEVDTEYLLSLAYSPGVAAPCKEIEKDPQAVFDYTSRGNLVGVVTNGTAVLGLGNIGPLASKPVMEGKGVLFKKFANINVFDIELDASNVEDFIQTVKALEPTFGGINLEDIKAPDCFIIEQRLKEELSIPVFHDDQHGTAIISTAALLNAVELTGKKLKDVKIVFNGAGAAALSCAQLFVDFGVNKKNLFICDSKGVIRNDRNDLNEYKQRFSQDTQDKTLADALKGADVFCGLSVGGVLIEPMLKSMAKDPIIFAMANPDPEVDPNFAVKVRPDAIIATGRSDFPNQVNNVLGFPAIFRGALDVQATHINEAMKQAAVKALAELARETVPDEVTAVYDEDNFQFGKDYIIPKPFDPRVLLNVAPAVAKAAMDSGVAKFPIKDWEAYHDRLESFQGSKASFSRGIIKTVKKNSAKNNKVPHLVFPEGESTKILKATQQILEEGFAEITLLGSPDEINQNLNDLDLPLVKAKAKIIDPTKSEYLEDFANSLYKHRQRKGLLLTEAEKLVEDPFYFSALMVQKNLADGLVSGATQSYAVSVKPVLEVLRDSNEKKVAAGVNLVLSDNKILFLADTTMLVNPTAEELTQVALQTAKLAESYGQVPRIAFLSYANYRGHQDSPKKMKRAAELTKSIRPDLVVDGDIQADSAINHKIAKRLFPFSPLSEEGANILIFPNLDAGNITYKMIQQLSDENTEVVGPILMGIPKPVNIVQRTGYVTDIIHAAAFTALEAQEKSQVEALSQTEAL